MIGRRRELRPGRAPGGLRQMLRWLAITFGVVLVATAAVPMVGVVIAGLFWVLLAAVLAVAAAAAAGPVQRAAPVVAGALVTASAWPAAHRPQWLGVPLAVASRLTSALTSAVLAVLRAVLPRAARRRRRRDLVAAVALPRVPHAALPPGDPRRDREPWNWAA